MDTVSTGGQTGCEQAPKKPNKKKGKTGREASREEANQNEYNKTSRSELHTHGYFEYQNDVGQGRKQT